MLTLPSERDAAKLDAWDERRRRELAGVRIGETDEESEPGPEPDGDGNGDEEPTMSDGERRLCTRCGTKPLRKDNKSGICSACRLANRKPRNGVQRAPSTASGFDAHALSDDDLVLCIAEARARVRSREQLAEILAGGG